MMAQDVTDHRPDRFSSPRQRLPTGVQLPPGTARAGQNANDIEVARGEVGDVRQTGPAARTDGPAGSQVPQRVIDAISDYLSNHNANHGGAFATSSESDAIVARTLDQLALFLNAPVPNSIVFGANMTTLTFAVSRAISARWVAGDEIIVTQLDHDANVAPWVRAALERGAIIKRVGIHADDCTLDLDDFRRALKS